MASKLLSRNLLLTLQKRAVKSSVTRSSIPWLRKSAPSSNWGYNGSELDPEDWPKEYQCGNCQSPIDIDLSKVTYSSELTPLEYSYPDKFKYMVNDGKNIRIHWRGETALSGGPLKGIYELVQLHFHWGSAEGKGAEHLVNGESVEGEAHLVHWNPKYGSIREALKHQDGCAVVGVFLKEADSGAESPLSPILNRFPTLSKFNEKYIFQNDIFNVGNLIPKNSDFICYDGGLTTPPLTECVQWIVLLEPLVVSKQEMDIFRSLEGSFGNNFIDNFRPCQPVGDRVVSSTFEPEK